MTDMYSDKLYTWNKCYISFATIGLALGHWGTSRFSSRFGLIKLIRVKANLPEALFNIWDVIDQIKNSWSESGLVVSISMKPNTHLLFILIVVRAPNLWRCNNSLSVSPAQASRQDGKCGWYHTAMDGFYLMTKMVRYRLHSLRAYWLPAFDQLLTYSRYKSPNPSPLVKLTSYVRLGTDSCLVGKN